jgi:regulator of replication initiation timing
MSDEIDYDAEEAALDAEIASMLNPSPDQDTDEQTQITAEPTNEVDTSAVDQTETEQQAEPTVPESRYKNLQAKMTQATQENAELRRENGELRQYAAQLQQQLQAKQQDAAPDTDDDDLDALTNDYPEIATPLVKRNKMLEQKLAQLEAQLGKVSDTASRFQQHEAQTVAEKHFATIKAVHPDFDTVTSDEAFHEWAEAQPPIIQACVKNGCSAEDAIMVLNLYKQAKGLNAEPAETVDKLAAAKQAASPKLPKNPGKPTSNKTNWTREQIAKMSMEEFAKHEAEIDEAIAQGLVY